jgi:hypothetical protein
MKEDCSSRTRGLKELNLTVLDLTPRKQKFYSTIRRKESLLSKLQKKYRSRRLKDQRDVDINSLSSEISNYYVYVYYIILYIYILIPVQ